MQVLHPVVQSILEKRNIEDTEAFFSRDYDNRPDPFLMRDMDKAVERILKAIQNKETIACWTDYDCDGIPAGALLSDFFKEINYPVVSYIPERSEGYGLNKEGIDELKRKGASLIITADCGITDNEEVEYAKSLGIDMIVSDHHLPSDELPQAVAVLNPHRKDCEYPFKELCGTGVAFKLVEALITKNSDLGGHYFSWTEGQEKWLLDLVALATVADMVPLTGENRTLVHFGLIVLKRGRRKGLVSLLKKVRVPLHAVTEDDFSFSIAPKINASSRMESPRLGLELLTATEQSRADELALRLVKLNDARKLEGARVSKEVKKRMEGLGDANVVVMGNSEWNPALLGIAATTIVETHQKTVCLWGKDGELIKGSCRSNGSVNIVSLMGHAEEAFLDYGGHELSGGFSLKGDSIFSLQETLEKAYEKASSETVQKEETKEHDGFLTLSEVNSSLYKSLRTLAPFGVGNKKPTFKFNRARVEKVLYFGKHKDHVRITLSDDNGKTVDAISFFIARAPFKDTVELLSEGDFVELEGSVEKSFFGNKGELRLRLEAMEFCQ